MTRLPRMSKLVAPPITRLTLTKRQVTALVRGARLLAGETVLAKPSDEREGKALVKTLRAAWRRARR